MASYGSSLATVVAIVVVVAAAAAVAAAAGLILASALRRRRLGAAATVAAEMLRLIRAEPRADVGGPAGEGRPPTLRELRPREWEWLLTTRSAEPGGIWALDELAGMPAELLAWAGQHGPPGVRAALPDALDLVAVDEDVRRHIATVGAVDRPGVPDPPAGKRDTPAERQQRLRALAVRPRFRPRG